MSAPLPVVVRKLDQHGALVVSYDATLAERVPGGVRLDARWARRRLALGYTTFEPGDRFIEWYYSDRWYSIFEIHTDDGRLKGWYCNVVAPAAIDLAAGIIACRDLLLDVWVGPDGATRVLDEDEFAAADLAPAERAAALAALDALLGMAARRAHPFDAMRGG